MALFGMQLVFSMVVASFLQKLGQHYSFARWLVCSRLICYLCPTDTDLRSATGLPSGGAGSLSGGKARRRNHDYVNAKSSMFTLPRKVDISLRPSQIQATDIQHLHFYPDYQWLVDFSLASLTVYFLTEVYNTYVPNAATDLNFSLLWLLLGMLFALKALFSITLLYFKAKEGGERTLCVTFGFFFLVVAMGVLIARDDVLEFGLNAAHENFSAGAMEFLRRHKINSQGPASLLTYKMVLGVVSAVLGSLLTFPGMRMAKLHLDSLKMTQDSLFSRVALMSNFAFPCIIAVSWVKPLVRDVIQSEFGPLGHKFAEELLDIARIWLILTLCLLRLLLMPLHMQSYLNSAYEQLRIIQREAGRISNLELRLSISRIYLYLCVVMLQYIAPVLLLLPMALFLKSTAKLSWLGGMVTETVHAVAQGAAQGMNSNGTQETILEHSAEFSTMLWELKSVFTAVWYKGIFSFLCWWTCMSWFITSCFGLLHHMYFQTT